MSKESPEQFPVVGEIWMSFQAILQTNAKRLCEDIAKQQGKPPKELWNKVKQIIQVPIIDEITLPEFPKLCQHFTSQSPFDTAIRERCRHPCLIGFDACESHVGKPLSVENSSEKVKRVLDMDGNSYFQREDGLVVDKIGRIRGTVSEDGVLMLFTKRK